MNHKLLAARAPLAWIALGLVVTTALVHLVVAGAQGALAVDTVAGALAADAVALLLMVLLVLSCLFPPVPQATKALAISAAVAMSVLTMAAVVQAIIDLQAVTPPTTGWDVLAAGTISVIAPRLVLTIAAWVLLAGLVSSSATGSAQQRAVESPQSFVVEAEGAQPAAQDPHGAEDSPPAVPSSEDHAPTWQLDKASGVVWQSAAAAATGEQGSGYGMPGQARGSWQPVPALQSSDSSEGDPPAPEASPDSAASPASAEPPRSPDSAGDVGTFSEEPSAEKPTAKPSTKPAGRRFAAASANSPSSADSPTRN